MQTAINENEVNVQSAEVPEDGENRVCRLFNLLSLIMVLLMLAAEIYLLIAMNLGAIEINGVTFNAGGSANYLQAFMAAAGYDPRGVIMGDMLPTVLLLAAAYVLYAVFDILIIIGFIRCIIRLFRFFKLGRPFSEQLILYGKYARTVSKGYGLGVVFVCLSLTIGSSLTGAGTGILVIASLIYVFNCALITVFRHINSEEGFKLFDCLYDLGRKLVMFMLVCLFISGMNAISIGPIGSFRGELAAAYSSSKVKTAMIYFTVGQPLCFFIIDVGAISIAAKISGYGALNNGRKDVNGKVRKMSISIIVFSIIFCVLDCIMLGMKGGSGAFSLICAYWLSPILVSIACTVLSFTYRDKIANYVRG